MTSRVNHFSYHVVYLFPTWFVCSSDLLFLSWFLTLSETDGLVPAVSDLRYFKRWGEKSRCAVPRDSLWMMSAPTHLFRGRRGVVLSSCPIHPKNSFSGLHVSALLIMKIAACFLTIFQAACSWWQIAREYRTQPSSSTTTQLILSRVPPLGWPIPKRFYYAKPRHFIHRRARSSCWFHTTRLSRINKEN